MMALSVYLMVATIVVFTVAAGFALAWSIAAGQWRDPERSACVVLDDDEEA